tara:strand:- start:716 stop:1057 length:342 start_codon:yes stop_codon:yes gene_type:complete
MIIYHNPRCTKSREGLAYLEEKGQKAEVREYLKEAFTKDELAEVIQKLGIEPSALLRKNEQIYKDQYKGKDIKESQWIDIMLEHPRLIERPIIVSDDKAVIGRPKEEIDKLLA